MREYNKSIINHPLLGGEDSVTILSRMQAKRKEERVKSMVEEEEFTVNRARDHFVLSESKVAVFDSRVTTK